jgi:hypothetical protein
MPLTAEEVEQLRRIHELSSFGELPAHVQALLDELLARDTDAVLVAPVLDIQIIPAATVPRGCARRRVRVRATPGGLAPGRISRDLNRWERACVCRKIKAGEV